eukprot:1094187-Rhodomonas_salina.1
MIPAGGREWPGVWRCRKRPTCTPYAVSVLHISFLQYRTRAQYRTFRSVPCAIAVQFCHLHTVRGLSTAHFFPSVPCALAVPYCLLPSG